MNLYKNRIYVKISKTKHLNIIEFIAAEVKHSKFLLNESVFKIQTMYAFFKRDFLILEGSPIFPKLMPAKSTAGLILDH